jgi:hypothetical protein
VNVNGAVTAAQNEALNNSSNHAADAAKNGGLLSAFGTWFQNTYGDPLGSLQNWGNQLTGLLKYNNGYTPPSDPNNQLPGSNNGNPPNTGASPVTFSVTTCVPGEGCVMTPPLVSPGSPNNAPSNATLSSGSGGDDGGSATGQGAATNTAATGANVWGLNPIARGVNIESQLAHTEYSAANGWYQVGAENNGYFPLVDFQNGNTLVSLKTVDTTGSTWLPRMEGVIDQLGSSNATVNGSPANMVLDMRVQPGGAAAAQQLISYGARQGVTVRIKVYP